MLTVRVLLLNDKVQVLNLFAKNSSFLKNKLKKIYIEDILYLKVQGLEYQTLNLCVGYDW